MKADKRNQWTYKGCQIIPVDCQHPTWGQCGMPMRFATSFRSACRNRYWRIDFPDKTWVHAEFKSDAKDYIDKNINKHQAVAV